MEERHRPVGGLAFYSSLVFLTLLAVQNTRAIISLLNLQTLTLLCSFAAAAAAGAIIARQLLPETACVFIHEFKHALLSGLAGNKVKGLVVRRRSGHFEYSYTKETAPYNAFISLAPYITPLLSFPAAAALVIVRPSWHFQAVLLAGLAYGADLFLNARDISPAQTDITGIRGGYRIGRLYILVCNAAFLTFLAAWAAAGREGLVHLLEHLWTTANSIAGISR